MNKRKREHSLPTDRQAVEVAGLHLEELVKEPSFDRITRLAARCLRAPCATFSILLNGRQHYVSTYGFRKGLPTAVESLPVTAVTDNRMINVADTRSHPHYKKHAAVTGESGIRFFAAYPIQSPTGQSLGALAVFDICPRYLQADELADLGMFSQLMESALLNRHAAVHDALTGLFNRRHFSTRATREWEQTRYHLQPLIFVIMDLDHFKRLNDEFGHARGDAALRDIGALLREHFKRSEDTVARYGGEEFAALLPATSTPNAITILQALRLAVAGLGIPNPGCEAGVQTLSIGLACYRYGGNNDVEARKRAHATPDRMLAHADKALYLAKSAGRNSLAVWHGEDDYRVAPATAAT